MKLIIMFTVPAVRITSVKYFNWENSAIYRAGH